MGNYFKPQIPDTPQPFRISNFKEDELIVHRLQYLKTVLVQQRNEYQDKENKEIEKAKSLKKVNISDAKYHLQKVKISRIMKNRIQDRIYLVTKQIQNLESVQDDIDFSNIIENGNRLLTKLTKEVDSKSLNEALEVMEHADSNSKALNDLLQKFQGNNESELIKEFDEMSEIKLNTNSTMPDTPKVQTIEELERKELMYN